MSRKDYILTAHYLSKEVRYKASPECFTIILDTFCKVFKADNSNFDKERFIAACYADSTPQ